MRDKSGSLCSQLWIALDGSLLLSFDQHHFLITPCRSMGLEIFNEQQSQGTEVDPGIYTSRIVPSELDSTLTAAYFFFLSNNIRLYTPSISISKSLYFLFTCHVNTYVWDFSMLDDKRITSLKGENLYLLNDFDGYVLCSCKIIKSCVYHDGICVAIYDLSSWSNCQTFNFCIMEGLTYEFQKK
jgi:hypothetical protein